jgi:hypothetical protein
MHISPARHTDFTTDLLAKISTFGISRAPKTSPPLCFFAGFASV